MNISYNWLKEYLKAEIAVEQIASALNTIGLEVEAIEAIEEIKGSLQGVLIGEVKECEKHPDADKLKVTKVDVGTGELLQIVCGAPNVAAGEKVFVATIGTILYFSNGDELKIKKSKIRGVESFGMICAEDELGIGNSHDGIMILEKNAVIGTEASAYLKLESDIIFQIGLTPNRIDAASHIGVAIDLNTYLNHNKIASHLERPSITAFETLSRSTGFTPIKITVSDTTGAPRYAGISLENITIAPSPKWLQQKIRSIGLNPINNVIDITNFVLHETGQPLHAFDRSKIAGEEIVVRRAAAGETIVTLDGVERKLSTDDLMICNIDKPMCLAGIFGGIDSGISDTTTSIFLESAYFDPVSIRKSAKRHGLSTDASFRYERGANPEIVIYALKRAVILLHQLAGATVVGDIQESYPVVFKRVEIDLSFERIQRFIGKNIDPLVMIEILRLLEFEILQSDDNGAKVRVPLYRVDVTRECDVVEDILRIYGYDNIEFPEGVRISVNTTPKPDPEKIVKIVSSLLVDNGFYEIMNNSMTKSSYYEGLNSFTVENLARVLNPLSSDLGVMRQSLLFGGLEVVAYNINRKRNSLKLFELGSVYSFVGDKRSDLNSYKENKNLMLMITGNPQAEWTKSGMKSSYFMIKGFVELLLARFGIALNDLKYSSAPADLFDEGLVYSFADGKQLATIGSVNSKILKSFDIKQSVYAAEISFPVLLRQFRKKKVLYSELPKFPEVKRDLALILDEQVPFVELLNLSYSTERKFLKSVSLFDIYRGDKIPAGKKQYVLSFILRDDEKTLNDRVVEDVMNRLLKSFSDKFGALIR